MTERPQLSKLPLWEEREAECIRLLIHGLEQLETSPPEEQDEDSINRRLMRCLDATVAASGGSLGPVVYEGRSSPAPSDDTRVPREFKRPDFAWLWIDDLAADLFLSRREFAIECKRLAAEPFPTRYVTDGIMRFVNPSHAYGKDMSSGAMVGYMQSISVDTAIRLVNDAAVKRDIPALLLRSRGKDRQATLEHRVSRNFDVSPFLLTHLWVQLA